MDLTAKVITHGMKRRPDIQPKVEFVSIERQFIYDDPNPDRYDVSTKQHSWNHRHGNTSRFLPRIEKNAFEDQNKSILKRK
jgi:hypothetical protein